MLHRDGDTRREATAGRPGLEQLGRSLQKARVSKGLGVPDAAQLVGVSAGEIEALEEGLTRRLPDQVETVNLLRRYANALGLPADRYALALLDAWPATAAGPAGPSEQPTGVVSPAVSPHTGMDQEHTGLLPAHRSPAMTPVDTDQVPAYVKDTGSHDAVPWGPHAIRGRTRPSLVLLRSLVAVVLVLVLAGGAALAINHWRPQLLRSLDKTPPPAAAAAKGATATTQTAGGITGSSSASAAIPSSPGRATVKVHGSGAQVRISAVGGTSWVEVQAPGHSAPLYAADLPSGSHQQFPLQSSLTVQVGSASAHLSVLLGNKAARSYVPATAPFTYDFQQN